MRRIHAVELEDLPWLPSVLREAGMAYLRFAAERTGQADHIRPVIAAALQRSGDTRILDLCSGGGGPILAIARGLEVDGRRVDVTLSDLYPNPGARKLIEAEGAEWAHYGAEPVNASQVPPGRIGLRTLFNGFHHFDPEAAQGVLADAVAARQPIVIVEVLRRSWIALVSMLFTPLVVLLVVPLLRPFRPAWLVLTYLIPVIPLFIMWDGIVSCLRIYSRDELFELSARADSESSYDWSAEDISMPPAPVPGIAFVGMPRERATEPPDHRSA